MRPALAMMLSALVALAAVSTAGAQWSSRAVVPELDEYALDTWLSSGRVDDAYQALAERVKARPADHDARLGLAIARLAQAVQTSGRELYSYGPRPDPALNMLGYIGIMVPQMPLPPNSNPKEVSYDDLRNISARFLADLGEVDTILAPIPPAAAVRVPLHFGLIRLDLDGDGQATDSEALWRIIASISRTPGLTVQSAQNLLVKFDRADVEWLRAYCHLLSAVCECSLAYDQHDLFERTAHLVFPRPKTPYRVRDFWRTEESALNDQNAFLDLVAVIHLVNFPVVEPKRMESARQHLLKMLLHSETMLKMVVAETDDDHEWIPAPKQTSALFGMRLSADMFAAWQAFLGEARELLEGRKLIPFWRGDSGRGVNLKRVFTEPTRFDLVLWIQGTGAWPYVEDGVCTSEDTWRRFQQVFQGRFWNYAAWIN